MAYEVFKRTTARVDKPTVAIAPDGRMAVNAAAVRILSAASVKHVLLLWDQEGHRLAIKATQKSDKDAYALSIAPGTYSGGIRAQAFLSHIGWNARRRETLPATWNETEKMLEVELPVEFLRPTTEKTSRRRLL